MTHIQKYAQITRRLAMRRRILRGIWTWMAYTLTVAALVSIGWFFPRPMRLPEPYKRVVAYTVNGPYIAYVDEEGEFHEAYDHRKMGQVVFWHKPIIE